MEAPRQLQDHHDEAHHDLPSEPGPNPIGKACNFCRISHTACGPERPCRRCIKIGKAHLCSDVQMRKRGRPRKTDPRYRPRDRKAAAAAAASSSSSTSYVAPPDNSTDDRHRMTVAVHPNGAGTDHALARRDPDPGHQQRATHPGHYDTGVPLYFTSPDSSQRELSSDDDDNGSDDNDGGSDYDDDDDDDDSALEDGGFVRRGSSAVKAESQLANNVIEMMSAEMRKMRKENHDLREKMRRLKEKHKQAKKRLAEFLDLDQRPHTRMKIDAIELPRSSSPASAPPPPPSSTAMPFSSPPQPPPLISAAAVSPSLREARKYLPFLNHYNIPPERPFVIDNMFSHPISAVVVNGMEVSTPPLFLFTNDAFATMLQFLPSELAGSSLVGVWAQNAAIARRMAPVLVAKAPWSVSEVYRMSSLLRRRDGTTFRAVSHVQFFYDHSGMAKYSIAKMLKWKNDVLHEGEQFDSWVGIANLLFGQHHAGNHHTAPAPYIHPMHHHGHLTSHRSASPPSPHSAPHLGVPLSSATHSSSSAPDCFPSSSSSLAPPSVASLSTSPYSYSSPPSSLSQHGQLGATDGDSASSERDDMCYLAQLLFDAPPSDYAQFADYSHEDIHQPQHQHQVWDNI